MLKYVADIRYNKMLKYAIDIKRFGSYSKKMTFQRKRQKVELKSVSNKFFSNYVTLHNDEVRQERKMDVNVVLNQIIILLSSSTESLHPYASL